jgi:hypothetical protein
MTVNLSLIVGHIEKLKECLFTRDFVLEVLKVSVL